MDEKSKPFINLIKETNLSRRSKLILIYFAQNTSLEKIKEEIEKTILFQQISDTRDEKFPFTVEELKKAAKDLLRIKKGLQEVPPQEKWERLYDALKLWIEENKEVDKKIRVLILETMKYFKPNKIKDIIQSLRLLRLLLAGRNTKGMPDALISTTEEDIKIAIEYVRTLRGLEIGLKSEKDN